MFGIYIDEFKEFYRENMHKEDGCSLDHVLITMILFTYEVVLTFSTKGFHIKLEILSSFYDHCQHTIKVRRTKVMSFNTSDDIVSIFHCFFKGGITTTYTYSGSKLMVLVST